MQIISNLISCARVRERWGLLFQRQWLALSIKRGSKCGVFMQLGQLSFLFTKNISTSDYLLLKACRNHITINAVKEKMCPYSFI